MSTGPIEVLVLGFPGNQLSGEILPELANLVDSGQIAILDLEFVAKTVDGDVVTLEAADTASDASGAFRARIQQPRHPPNPLVAAFRLLLRQIRRGHHRRIALKGEKQGLSLRVCFSLEQVCNLLDALVHHLR